MTRWNPYCAATLILAGALVLVGCGDDEGTDDGGTESDSDSEDGGTASDGTSGEGDTSGGSGGTGDGTGTGGTGSTSSTGATGETSGTEPECNADLHGAPEPVVVPGGTATPIDIKSVDVKYTFDLDLQRATGDALVRFEMGETDGLPILDLRQSVTEVELDGEPLDTDLFHYQELGGGEGADMRVLEQTLGACTDHELRLVYAVGEPHGSGWGGINWNSTSVWFSTALNDLSPGGFSEKWMPANLSYDQVAVTMEVEIVGDAAPHLVFCNGEVEDLDTQEWRVVFPDYFVTFSPYCVLTPAASVDHHTRVVSLPEGDVTIEAYFRSGDVDRTLDTLEDSMIAFRDMYGPYLHGDRYLAYIREGGGGMEYEGATDSGDEPGVLSHELFHSWFARGLRPITATDGWWDEAWTTYNTGGDTFEDYEALPFDYPAEQLYDPNPWVRHTNIESYGYGAQVFATMRESIGAQVLIDVMAQLYVERPLALISTDELQQHIYCQGGEHPDVLQIFHHFIHAEPGDAPDPPADYCD